MTDHLDIDRLLQELARPGSPTDEESGTARAALQTAIRREKERRTRVGRRSLSWRFAMAGAAMAPAAVVILVFALVIGSVTPATALDRLASTSVDGALAGAQPGLVAEVESSQVRLVSTRGVAAFVSETRVVRTAPDGRRTALVTVTGTSFSSGADAATFAAGGPAVSGTTITIDLPPLTDPSTLDGDAGSVLAELTARVDPSASAGSGSSILDTAAGALLDPRLSAAQRAAVLRALGGVPGITRTSTGTGAQTFTLAGSVSGVGVDTSISVRIGGELEEHRVVLTEASEGLAPGTTVYAARHSPARLVAAVATGDAVTASSPDRPTVLRRTFDVPSAIDPAGETMPGSEVPLDEVAGSVPTESVVPFPVGPTVVPVDGTTPTTIVPAVTDPGTTLPVVVTPTTSLPVTTVPGTTIPGSTSPETTLPETTVPEVTVPTTLVPSTTVPSSSIPLVTTTVPSTTLVVSTTIVVDTTLPSLP
jgi:hypothetical protein